MYLVIGGCIVYLIWSSKPVVGEAGMLNKNELFRRLNSRSPEVVERLIVLWGSPELAAYINELMSGAKGEAAATDEYRFVLSSLKAEHDKEFPRHAAPLLETKENNVLAQNAEFNTVNVRFPRIGQRILATWGSAIFCEYANELMNDKREGHRQGFPEDVVVALFRLMQEHDKQFPQFVLKITDIWSLTNKF
jgi:hypothetical protein